MRRILAFTVVAVAMPASQVHARRAVAALGPDEDVRASQASPDGRSGSAVRAIDPAMPTSVSSEILAPAPAASVGPRDPREEYVESLLRQRRARQRSSPEPPEPPPRGIGMMVTGGVLAVPVAGITVLLGVAVRNSAGLFLLSLFLDSKVPARSPASGPQGWLARAGPGAMPGATDEPFSEFKDPAARACSCSQGRSSSPASPCSRSAGFSKWRKWEAGQQRLAPSVGRTAFGTWTPGLALRV